MDDKEILSGLDAEEQKRLEKIEKLDSNQSRKKIIFACVTVFLVALFVLGTTFGGRYILRYEGSQALPAEEYAPLEIQEGGVLPAVDELIKETENYASVKLDSHFRAGIDADSIAVAGQNSESDDITKELLLQIAGTIGDKLSELYSAGRHEGAYGEDFSPFLPDFNFSMADADTAELKVNEENPNELIGTFTFPGCTYDELPSAPVYRIFDLDDVPDVIKAAEDAFTSAFTVDSLDMTYEDFVISAFIGRELKDGEESRQLNRLVYTRTADITLGVTFTGDLAEYGKKEISFRMNCSEEYNFSRVSFRLVTPVYFIEKGNSDEINRRISSDESVQEIKIVWESSDPDVLSVDEKGFYKGKKVSGEPVTVKGTYTYNGVEYTDECLFYVRVPAESVKLSEKEITLKAGEEYTLEPTVKPADATLKDVYWFTTDESIATVEDGTVKAVAPGEAGIYVITFDGNFKKTCAVTVEG